MPTRAANRPPPRQPRPTLFQRAPAAPRPPRRRRHGFCENPPRPPSAAPRAQKRAPAPRNGANEIGLFNMKITTLYVAFTDECSWNVGRYRSISSASMPTDIARSMHIELCKLANESNINELKWTKLSSAKMRFAAEKYINCALSDRYRRHLRIDTLTWNIEDTRCKNVYKRDDIKNYNTMYYQLLHHVLHNVNRSNLSWTVIADENTAGHWEEISICLKNKRIDRGTRDAFYLEVDDIPNQFLDKVTVINGKSEVYNIIQLADLFAGIAVYSCNRPYIYDKVIDQPSLLEKECVLSKRDRERIEFLKNAIPLLKSYSPTLVWTDQGLSTKDPKEIINFWLYQPQGVYDKAPTKTDR